MDLSRRQAALVIAAACAAGAAGCSGEKLQMLLLRAHEGDDLARGELMALGETGSLSGFAAFAVGQAYDPGLFPPGDPHRAASFYRNGRGQEPRAAHNLAVLVLTGLLTESEAQIAPQTLQQLVLTAAERGVAQSMILAGEFYTLGVQSFPYNPVLATWWLEKAVSASGDPWARYRLGASYLSGAVRSKNRRFAYDLLASAAKAGVPEAAQLLASSSADPVVAARWAVVAARMRGDQAKVRSLTSDDLHAHQLAQISNEVRVWLAVHGRAWAEPARIIRPVV